MRLRRIVVLLSLNLVVLGPLIYPSIGIASGTSDPIATSTSASAERKSCIDPKTGRLVLPKDRPDCQNNVTKQKDATNGKKQSDQELKVEERPDGSKKIDLKGRFKQHRTISDAPQTRSTGGRLAIIDPQTGQLTTGQAAERLRQREELRPAFEEFQNKLKAMRESQQDVSGLVVEQMATGGFKIDLKGRFRNPLLATTGADNDITIRHGNPTQ